MATATTRTFRNGNSEAVRLPRGVGFGVGTEISVEREGDAVILRAVHDADAAKRRWRAMIARLKALPAPGEIEKREPIEFPDRAL